MQNVAVPNVISDLMLQLYVSIMYFVSQSVDSCRSLVSNSYGNKKEVQTNGAIWIVVLGVVVIFALFIAACALIDKNFSGEFKFFGAFFKVKCW